LNKIKGKKNIVAHIWNIIWKYFFIFKNKVYPCKRYKTIIDESKKLFKFKCITKKNNSNLKEVFQTKRKREGILI
jgi:hypothetical protein